MARKEEEEGGQTEELVNGGTWVLKNLHNIQEEQRKSSHQKERQERQEREGRGTLWRHQQMAVWLSYGVVRERKEEKEREK